MPLYIAPKLQNFITRREVANFLLRIVTLQPRTNMEKTLQPRRKSLSQKTPNEKEKLIRNQNEYSPPHARSNATNVKTNPMTEQEIITVLKKEV